MEGGKREGEALKDREELAFHQQTPAGQKTSSETALIVSDGRQKHGSLSVSLKGGSPAAMPKERFASSQLQYKLKLLKIPLASLLLQKRR